MQKTQLFSKDKKEEPKLNIIQFLPYFPPHKWWLETVAEEWSYFYVKKAFWEVINITFDVGQEYDNILEFK